MNNSSRWSSEAARQGFRWPQSTARKLARARVPSGFGREQARKKVKQTRAPQWRQRLLIGIVEAAARILMRPSGQDVDWTGNLTTGGIGNDGGGALLPPLMHEQAKKDRE
jgi:hypothetical protein